MDDVIKLIRVTDTGERDKYLNKITNRTERTVLCRVESVARSEFYQASQTGLHPTFTFVLSYYIDYEGETEVEYNGAKYDVIRTFRRGDEIEIVCQERTGERT